MSGKRLNSGGTDACVFDGKLRVVLSAPPTGSSDRLLRPAPEDFCESKSQEVYSKAPKIHQTLTEEEAAAEDTLQLIITHCVHVD
ncbi:hypothetical protein PBY51_001198 [Eleginops maclovinus]|uniref:Uncharacterized protein n=1 Tax=Eleginops maclovinus TaxID=56733 RepID=A0AAN8APX9_ELEMC|nr:hypothetical protein PBY51_001198 [Eleginops maclovinus]